MRTRKLFLLFLVPLFFLYSYVLSQPPMPVPPQVWQQAKHLAITHPQLGTKTIACLIDFSRPSSEKRLWIICMADSTCVLNTWVAHGRGSGRTAQATVFSNQAETYCSSLGLFLPKGKFTGKHGLSLRLSGIEPGVNDNAEARGIIFHAAPYVNSFNATSRQRQGNSQGCFVVAESEIREVVRLLNSPHAFVWATFPTFPEQK